MRLLRQNAHSASPDCVSRSLCVPQKRVARNAGLEGQFACLSWAGWLSPCVQQAQTLSHCVLTHLQHCRHHAAWLSWETPALHAPCTAQIASASDLTMQLAMQQAAAEIQLMEDDSEDEDLVDDEDVPDLDEGCEGKGAALRTLRKMQYWWQLREPLLPPGPGPADFEFEASFWKELEHI